MILVMKANDQLRTWFEDDDALERAMNGESVYDPWAYSYCHSWHNPLGSRLLISCLLFDSRWILLPAGQGTDLHQPINLSREGSTSYIIGHELSSVAYLNLFSLAVSATRRDFFRPLVS